MWLRQRNRGNEGRCYSTAEVMDNSPSVMMMAFGSIVQFRADVYYMLEENALNDRSDSHEVAGHTNSSCTSFAYTLR